MLSALRPHAEIIAGTPSPATAARLSLVWGVTPIMIETPTLEALRAALLARQLAARGDVVVFVMMHPILGGEGTNFMHVERI
jgi:pyruvate kinase